MQPVMRRWKRCENDRQTRWAAWRDAVLTGFLGATLTSLPVVTTYANPQGAKVVAGDATIARDGARMDIHQSTDRAIIDWRSFSIGADEITRFHQPSAASVTLNRVTGADPSRILGQLQANGQIMLINPNGILFGAGSRIDVSGLVATTADIANADFLAGRYDFQDGAAVTTTGVLNRGQITIADTGYAALVGPYVRNEGVVNARLGRVSLAGAEAFTLDLYGDRLVTLRVGVRETPVDDSGTAVATLVDNTGRIAADGGIVQLAARNVGAVVRSVVNTDGVIHADTIEKRDGAIILGASGAGDVTLGGELRAEGGAISVSGDGDVRVAGATASAAEIAIAADADESGAADATVTTTGGDIHVKDSNLKGSRIDITGDRVALTGTTTIDATGANGGGQVRIGGAFQGGDGLRAADATYVGDDAAIRADALETGDGGRAIVWANGSTRFLGSISATGGALGGNGGFAEVSGEQYLDFRGAVDLTAPHGDVGTLLLDPTDIVISADNTDTNNGGNILFADAPALEPWNVSAPALDAVGGNVVLQATNTITLTAGNNIALTTPGASLSLTAGGKIIPAAAGSITTADGNITINGTVDDGGAGYAIVINAGTGSVTGTGFIMGGPGVGGSLSITGSNIDTGSILVSDTVTLTSTPTGTISGSGLNVASLTLNDGASVSMFGAVAGSTGPAAAAAAAMLDSPNHLINYCQKSGACFYPPSTDDLDLVPTDPDTSDPPGVDDTAVDLDTDSDAGDASGDGGGGGSGPGGSDLVTDGSFDALPGDGLVASDFGLDFFLMLLEEEGLDLEELERQIRGVRGPLADLAADLDGILDQYEMAVAAFVPQDAFGGKFAVVVRGLVNFQPPASKAPASGPGALFVAPGFGIFQQ